MKTFLGFLLGVCFMGVVVCGNTQYNPSNPNNIRKIDADQFNFNKHNGKTIQSIQYITSPHTVPGCDDFIIWFTDGTQLRMFINKYIPEIEY